MKTELEKFYITPDPWGFRTNKSDLVRKKKILSQCDGLYHRTLDIGCGEGWITKDLPGKVYGYELSDKAKSRCPSNVTLIDEPSGNYDLVLACGVMYSHYDYQGFLDIIAKHASKRVITCNIDSWEVEDVKNIGKQLHAETFVYRQYKQRLRVFEVTPCDR